MGCEGTWGRRDRELQLNLSHALTLRYIFFFATCSCSRRLSHRLLTQSCMAPCRARSRRHVFITFSVPYKVGNNLVNGRDRREASCSRSSNIRGDPFPQNPISIITARKFEVEWLVLMIIFPMCTHIAYNTNTTTHSQVRPLKIPFTGLSISACTTASSSAPIDLISFAIMRDVKSA